MEGKSDGSYTLATTVQPKRVTTESDNDPPVYRNAEQDHVKSAFTSTACVGIRSLPNALTPNFRQVLLQEALEQTKLNNRTEAGTGTGGNPVTRTDPLSVEVGPGQRRPDKHSAVPGVFSTYDYHHSEYGREREILSDSRRTAKEKWIGRERFKISALPSIPKSVGAFNEFDYTIDPYEYAEIKHKMEVRGEREKIRFGPMKTGGNVQTPELMKIRVEELVGRLSTVLHSDWPKVFLRVFEDNQGLIVVGFDKQKMGTGANVTSYMGQFFRTHEIVQEFQLKRDTTRWGVMEDTVPTVYYVFIPPWVHARIVHPELSKVPDCKPVPGLTEPSLATGRVPFMPQTEGGLMVDPVYVQTFPNTFKV